VKCDKKADDNSGCLFLVFVVIVVLLYRGFSTSERKIDELKNQVQQLQEDKK
jgi:hypothetical protein